jgi:tyrosyl-tRNA synthetase
MTGRPIEPTSIELVERRSGDEIRGDLRLSENAFAVVPISNSVMGDVFDFTPFYSFSLIDQVELCVEFWLGNQDGKTESIVRVATKNTVYEQIGAELSQRLPQLSNEDRNVVISTSAAAAEAKNDPSLAAICSRKAIEENNLQVVGGALAKRVTTFGIFRAQPEREKIQTSMRTVSALNLFLRNADLYPGFTPGGGIAEFAQKLGEETGEKLVVKWGIDPLRESLHLGHFSNLLKLHDFLDAGHKVVVVLGTFTGKIGDPSGNLDQRERLEAVDLKRNAERIRAQIELILGKRVEFRENDELTSNFTLDYLIKWGYKIDVGWMNKRQDFQQRAKSGKPLHLSELLYALFQAHDSIQLEVDVEIGGIDQVYNCSMVRQIMQIEGRKPEFALLQKLLPGTDGDAKMSSYKGNDILLSESRSTIREKLLEVGQHQADHIFQYMRLITQLPDTDIAEWQAAHQDPKVLSRRMADAVLEVLPEGLQARAEQ